MILLLLLLLLLLSLFITIVVVVVIVTDVVIIVDISIIFSFLTFCRTAPRHPAAAGLQKKRKRSWVRQCTSRGCCMRTRRR